MIPLTALSRAAAAQVQRRQADLDKVKAKQDALLAGCAENKSDPGKNYWKPVWDARTALKAAEAVREAIDDVSREIAAGKHPEAGPGRAER